MTRKSTKNLQRSNKEEPQQKIYECRMSTKIDEQSTKIESRRKSTRNRRTSNADENLQKRDGHRTTTKIDGKPTKVSCRRNSTKNQSKSNVNEHLWKSNENRKSTKLDERSAKMERRWKSMKNQRKSNVDENLQNIYENRTSTKSTKVWQKSNVNGNRRKISENQTGITLFCPSSLFSPLPGAMRGVAILGARGLAHSFFFPRLFCVFPRHVFPPRPFFPLLRGGWTPFSPRTGGGWRAPKGPSNTFLALSPAYENRTSTKICKKPTKNRTSTILWEGSRADGGGVSAQAGWNPNPRTLALRPLP